MNIHAVVSGLALTLSACAMPADRIAVGPLDPQTLVGTAWLAKEVAPAGAPARTIPRLQFLTATQVGGTGGCNNFGGALKVDGAAWQLGPLASTRKMCMGPEMETEKQFFSLLDRARSASLNAGVLSLADASGAVVLRLVRAE